ncbi:MAG TPA: hypothetical protein VEL11_04145 [Candidatus Bathyarchaeia archaeon]|nr:hypothetical protein [Candidatus Bathyarchaeia archaeon]
MSPDPLKYSRSWIIESVLRVISKRDKVGKGTVMVAVWILSIFGGQPVA